MSPEKGGVLRTDLRRAFRRSILVVAAVALPVAPLAALNSTTPSHRVHALSLAAPLQEPLAAHIPTSTVLHETVSAQLRHFVVVPKPRHIVHHVSRGQGTVVLAAHRRPAHRVLHPVHHHAPKPVHHHTPTPVHHRKVVHPNHRVGIATWYDWHPGQCATSYLPHGTRIWIRDLDTGRVISCVVTDTQAYNPQRVVDLSQTQFAELAPLSTGIVRVEVSW